MQDFRNLKVWGKAHFLTLDVYKKTRGFPAEERFGWRRNCGDRVLPCLRISQKVVLVAAKVSSRDL